MTRPDIRGRLEADPVYWIDMQYAAEKYLRDNPDDTLNRAYVEARRNEARTRISEFMGAGELTPKAYLAELALQQRYDQ